MFEPIGYFKTPQRYAYDAGRQSTTANSTGCIELQGRKNFEQALIGLQEIQRIWIIFQFHHNENWKPMIRPPRGSHQKIGVFATRAPYRPNAIGLSCVPLLKIEGLKIFVGPADLLDGTPILDIKPYLSYSDSFPDSQVPWLDQQKYLNYILEYSELSLQQMEFLFPLPLGDFLENQLSFHPTDTQRKRVIFQNENEWIICYRTWRILFTIHDNQKIKINSIYSGYSACELFEESDPYQDKELHRRYNKIFGVLPITK